MGATWSAFENDVAAASDLIETAKKSHGLSMGHSNAAPGSGSRKTTMQMSQRIEFVISFGARRPRLWWRVKASRTMPFSAFSPGRYRTELKAHWPRHLWSGKNRSIIAKSRKLQEL